MTIEQLLGKTADEIEHMTDAELLTYFGDKLAITRPTEELRLKNSKDRGPSRIDEQPEMIMTPQQIEQRARAKALAAEVGIDLEGIL